MAHTKMTMTGGFFVCLFCFLSWRGITIKLGNSTSCMEQGWTWLMKQGGLVLLPAGVHPTTYTQSTSWRNLVPKLRALLPSTSMTTTTRLKLLPSHSLPSRFGKTRTKGLKICACDLQMLLRKPYCLFLASFLYFLSVCA